MNEFFKTIITGFKFLQAKMSGGRMPIQMHIRVIDRCNLHCKYCFGDYPVRNLPPPSTEQLFAVLDGLGIEKAWESMEPHNCAACIQTGGNMYNALFALNPSTVIHYLLSFLRLPGKKG